MQTHFLYGKQDLAMYSLRLMDPCHPLFMKKRLLLDAHRRADTLTWLFFNQGGDNPGSVRQHWICYPRLTPDAKKGLEMLWPNPST